MPVKSPAMTAAACRGLFLLVALANWVTVVPQMSRILVGADDSARDRLRPP